MMRCKENEEEGKGSIVRIRQNEGEGEGKVERE
jgi:hypothetical protein